MKHTMKFINYRRLLVLAIIFTGIAHPQTPTDETAANTQVLAYIDHGWDTLSRSMTDCKSLVDPKVTTAPVLYLPAGIATPPALIAMQHQCKVEVRYLPRKITHIGEVQTSELPVEGLLYLPNPYVVPGGRFNEMYGWDSYFIILGLVKDNRTDLARGMIENFFFEIENYGAILNANRTYFFTRSQPPLLTSMIREVYESPANKQSKTWLARAYSYAQRDYALWISAPHRAGDTGLARYRDLGEGPVPEMADDSDYYPSVIHWLLAHPEVHTSYLIDAPDDPTPTQAATLSQTSCDITASKVCARAHVDGHRLSRAFYEGDRAMRESGFDTSFRFGPFSGSTDDYAPVCLNSLLFKYERDMAHFAALLGRTSEAKKWTQRATARQNAINKFLWNSTKAMFYDYDFTTHQPSTYIYATTFYPLWANVATPQQASAVEHNLALFEHDGGIAMSDTNSGVQWDLPFGWAPINWLATKGLVQYGFNADATRIATKFSQTVRQNFLHDGTIREKYNMVEASGNVKVSAGYKSNVIGFGWTNGVYLEMNTLLNPAKKQATPTP
jgi:alpha,alpha-trehalase